MTRVRVATIEVFAELGSPIQVEMRGPGPSHIAVAHVVNVRKTDVAAAEDVAGELRTKLVELLYDALQKALPHTRR